MQRDGVIGAAGIGIGILFFQARGDRTDLCARLFYIGPIFQAADETKEMRGAILDRVGDKRLERIKIFASHPDRIMKPRRHYADHGVGPERKKNLATDDVPVGIEVTLPRFIGENNDIGIGLLLVAGKSAPEKRSHRKGTKNIRSNSKPLQRT